MSGATASSGASPGGPKVSMFAAKSGFVIPRNKLSGSLVPTLKGSKKPGNSDTVSDDAVKQVQRKTKWGPDPTQDAAVRKGRALAYQTRVDQITQQLESGTLEDIMNLDLPISAEELEEKSLDHILESEKVKLLELEKREIIGEILKLNSSYKAPADYKPLLKEDRVPIPVKEHPGYNFVGLIFGPGGDNRKRLEKETGAKIQVYGKKAGASDKGEIISSDGADFHTSYEEIYVQISADTFEKVDAAVSVIELLITSVSGNLAAASTMSNNNSEENKIDQQGTPTQMGPASMMGHGVLLSASGTPLTPQRGQFQFAGPWIPTGSHTGLMHHSSGFIPLPNSSAPFPVHGSSAAFNLTNVSSAFSTQQAPVNSINSLPQNPSFILPRAQSFNQVLQTPQMPQTRPPEIGGPPRNNPMSVPRPSLVPPVHSGPLPFIGSQPPQLGPASVTRPLIPPFPQPSSSNFPGPFPDRPLTPAGGSTGWSPAGTPASQGPTMQVAPLQGPPAMVRQTTPTLISHNPAVFQPGLSTPPSSTPMNCPISAPPFAPAPSAQGGAAPAVSTSPGLLGGSPAMRLSIPLQSANNAQVTPINSITANPLPGSGTIPSPMPSRSLAPPFRPGPSALSGIISNFPPNRPTAANPNHQTSSFGDYTFHNQPQSSHSFPRQGGQSGTPIRPSNQTVRSSVPQAANFQSAVPDTRPGSQILPRRPMGNQMGRPPMGSADIPFPANPNLASVPPRHPSFPGMNPMGTAPRGPSMGPRNFSPVQRPDLAGTFSSRPGGIMQPQQNYHARPDFLSPPSQQLGNSFPSRPILGLAGQHVYDPFSPTSVSNAHHQRGGHSAGGRKQENDPEYEDLMASVGVK